MTQRAAQRAVVEASVTHTSGPFLRRYFESQRAFDGDLRAATTERSGKKSGTDIPLGHFLGFRLGQLVARHEAVDEADGPRPVAGAERVAARDHGRTGVEHLVLQMT